MKSEVTQAMADLPGLETVFVVRHAGVDAVPMTEGRDHWYHEALEAADDECPAEALDAAPRCASCRRAARRPNRRGSCTPPAAT